MSTEKSTPATLHTDCYSSTTPSEVRATSSFSLTSLLPSYKPHITWAFLPDFTEHPKPKKRKELPEHAPVPNIQYQRDDEDDSADVTFLHDFVAGGAAGSASVIVGHPFDTLKVRLQTSSTGTSLSQMIKNLSEYGGVAGLFRGMGAPLAAASAINAVVFTSYGIGSRFYDEYLYAPESFTGHNASHDPWQKSSVCGMFAGLVQCVIIAPMEHVKCRLQTQTSGSIVAYKGPVQAIQHITRQHGVTRLFQGWWSTLLREVPCFGLYFASYDYMKDHANKYLAEHAGVDTSCPKFDPAAELQHSHTWLASAFAGGMAGCLTWAIAYPVDVIKSRVQTSGLTTPRSDLRMWKLARSIIADKGIRYLYRGLGVTLIRAFPVNGTIFPVYEWTLMRVTEWTEERR